ncbi:MAG TPA: 2-C-methyl-D-erythritol 2,4-cyclodiphosphate synthase [Acidimicrobiales bacterium]|nr:2-C-methyl-D-erythritol 2,4-cyclodiphosphate synthase [Acidimicrobiales bacterium]
MSAPAAGAGPGAVRIGQGFDIHPFSAVPGRTLVLGGVGIPGGPGLQGHSDADALAHALTDAVLGAAGLGDIGRHFPDTDPAYAGVDSIDLLRRAVAMAHDQGFAALHADCTVICERPRLAEHLPTMGANLGGALGAPVNVKATRAEGLGALGRAEGIAAMAVVLFGGGLGTGTTGTDR